MRYRSMAVIAALAFVSSPLSATTLPPIQSEDTSELPQAKYVVVPPMFCENAAQPNGFGKFADAHVAERGNLIVPPQKYGPIFAAAMRGYRLPTTDDGIYSVAFQGMDEDNVVFEIRAYKAGSLEKPVVSWEESFPLEQETIKLHALSVAITSATHNDIHYTVKIAIPASEQADDYTQYDNVARKVNLCNSPDYDRGPIRPVR